MSAGQGPVYSPLISGNLFQPDRVTALGDRIMI